jgi:hypothetical protein
VGASYTPISTIVLHKPWNTWVVCALLTSLSFLINRKERGGTAKWKRTAENNVIQFVWNSLKENGLQKRTEFGYEEEQAEEAGIVLEVSSLDTIGR